MGTGTGTGTGDVRVWEEAQGGSGGSEYSYSRKSTVVLVKRITRTGDDGRWRTAALVVDRSPHLGRGWTKKKKSNGRSRGMRRHLNLLPDRTRRERASRVSEGRHLSHLGLIGSPLLPL